MRAKNKFLLSTLTLSLAATLTMGVATLSATADTQPESASVTHVKTDVTTGSAWEGVYGEDGYFFYGSVDTDAKTLSVYTKGLFTQNGQAYKGEVTFDVSNTGNGIDFLNKIVGDYASNGVIFTKIGSRGATVDNGALVASRLNVPGSTTDKATARFGMGGDSGKTPQGAPFAFTLSDALFETHDYVDITIYNAHATRGSVVATSYTTSVIDYYRTSTWNPANLTKPTSENGNGATQKATVTTAIAGTEAGGGGYYETFRFTKGGDYTIFSVPAAANTRGEVSGVFIDFPEDDTPAVTHNVVYNADGGTHTNPATYTEGTALTLTDAYKAGYKFEGWYDAATGGNKVTTISADETGDVELWARFTELVVPDNADMTTRGNWLNAYGEDGYLIWTSAWDGTTTVPQAYTKGIYNSGDNAYTGKVAYDATAFSGGALEMAPLGAFTMSNSIISRYGYYTNCWQNKQANAWYATGQYGDELYTPEWTETVPQTVETRVGASGNSRHAAFAFTLSEDLFDAYSYVDVSFYHSFAMSGKVKSNDAEDFAFTTEVYKDLYYTHLGGTELKAAVSGKTAMYSDIVPYSYPANSKDTLHKGFYITYRFTEAGDYTFVNWTDDTYNAYTATVSGVFFDLSDPIAQPTVNDITYNGVEGATHTNPATYTEGTAVTLTDASKDGYTFNGWYTTADFQEASKVTEISATTTGNVTLYAKFTQNAVTPPETSEPDDSTPDSSTDTTPPASSDEPTEPSTSTGNNTNSGCGSSIAGVGVVGAVMALATLVVACKKRKDD